MLHHEAEAAGIRATHLLVADTNPRAESLYRRLGFTTLPYRMMVQRLTPGSNS
jgi:ribosomal protein S18 acetylase RimI-like enzyme